MIKDIIQVVGSPAWSSAWTSIGIIVSTTLSIIALKRSCESNTPPTRKRTPLKKIYELERIFGNFFHTSPSTASFISFINSLILLKTSFSYGL